MASRTLTLRGTSYPLVLPTIRDPRLHVAAVILTVHLLGQLGLGFQLSVPQLLSAMLACAVIEVVMTFRQSRSFVWPASALLTGSGVALIFRLVGTPPDDRWTSYGWPVFAAVAGLSLLTKYLIRYRGSHVFNPSNIGLVVAFVLLGSSRAEPLDFWWAPLDAWMIAAYAVIIVGGLWITQRLQLLALAATFWIALAIGVGILAASGHCMTANWAFAPVCGVDFWRVIVTSPEVLIFLFFMITDPKTIPAGRVARVAFGLAVAVGSVLLMAPQGDEFGSKVGLLAGLLVISAVRPLVERLLPEPRSTADDLRRFATRLVGGGDAGPGIARRALRIGVVAASALVIGAGIVVAGSPARGAPAVNVAEILNRVPHHVDAGTFPPITVGQDVLDFDHTMAGPAGQQLVLTLAENLEVEAEALLRHDAAILVAVDHGDRLAQVQDQVRNGAATGRTTVSRYRFDAISLSLLVPFGRQVGLSIGLSSRGTVTVETYDAAGTLLSKRTSPFSLTFAMRRATGDRWLNVAVLPAGAGG